MINIVGIGLANIDLVSHVDEEILKQHDLIKGQAKKLSPEKFLKLKSNLTHIEVQAGGCVGNTLCGIDESKFKKIFFGKIGEDEHNKLYRESFKKHHVLYPVKSADHPSSQCAVLITPDGERTFAYIDGASWLLSAEDLYFETIASSNLIYTEIYAMAFGIKTGLWPMLINYMRDHKKQMALKIVDHEYINLYKNALFSLAEENILTLIIGNKQNYASLTNRKEINDILNTLSKWNCNILLTDEKNGAYYQENTQAHHHKVEPIDNPLNSSGAGDQFAAGFLEKWLTKHSIEECMKNAEAKARKVLMSDSPRPNS